MAEREEKREVVRLPLTCEALCRIQTESGEEVQSSASYGGLIRDLSIAGLFVETRQKPAVNRACVVSIVLQGEHSTLEIRDVRGKVTRRDDDGFVVTFLEHLEWFALVPIYFSRIPEAEF